MLRYIVQRLLLLIPTLLGILAITFAIIQFVPGGPVEQMVAQLSGSGALGEAAGSGKVGAKWSAQCGRYGSIECALWF